MLPWKKEKCLFGTQIRWEVVIRDIFKSGLWIISQLQQQSHPKICTRKNCNCYEFLVTHSRQSLISRKPIYKIPIGNVDDKPHCESISPGPLCTVQPASIFQMHLSLQSKGKKKVTLQLTQFLSLEKNLYLVRLLVDQHQTKSTGDCFHGNPWMFLSASLQQKNKKKK